MYLTILFVFMCFAGFSQQLPLKIKGGKSKPSKLKAGISKLKAGISKIDKNEVADLVIDLTGLDPSAYGTPIEQPSARSLRVNWNKTNADQMGPYLEGDILIPRPRPSPRNGLIDQSHLWKNGRIPYVISADFNEDGVERINWAIEQYHEFTCIKLVPKESSDTDYIEFTSTTTGCWSSLGRIGGRQQVNLQYPGCTWQRGVIIHEIMHAVGFMHEQNRPDRDEWVEIKFENIKEKDQYNFHKWSGKHVTTFDVPYNYNSVMHYDAYAFTINGEATIIPLVDTEETIKTMGQREQFADSDLEKIAKMYKCEGKESRLE